MRRRPEGFIEYLDVEKAGKPLRAERVRGVASAIANARGVQRLLRQAYERRFEEGDGELAPGTIRRHLANENNPLKVALQAARMVVSMRHGSDYWLIRDTERNGHLLALAQVSILEDDSLYVNDVLSAQEQQGLGTAVLYPALRARHASRGTAVLLDAYAGPSPANGWFQRMDMQPQGTSPSGPFVIGGTPLNQVRYQGDVGVMQSYMVQQHPDYMSTFRSHVTNPVPSVG